MLGKGSWQSQAVLVEGPRQKGAGKVCQGGDWHGPRHRGEHELTAIFLNTYVPLGL